VHKTGDEYHNYVTKLCRAMTTASQCNGTSCI